jgi:hypothetical protein
VPRSRGSVLTTVLVALLAAGCADPLSGASSPVGEDARSARASRPPSASTAPRPTETLPPVRLDLSWKELYGASVPLAGHGVGPRTRTSGGQLADWAHSANGAALAASYYAVAVDPRMPPRVWRHVLAGARPDGLAVGLARRFAADRAVGSVAPSATPLDEAASGQVWYPPVSVIAASGVEVTGESVALTVWSRTDDGRVWRSRRIRVRWDDGDWRLRLPLAHWQRARPPDELRPLAAGVAQAAR